MQDSQVYNGTVYYRWRVFCLKGDSKITWAETKDEAHKVATEAGHVPVRVDPAEPLFDDAD